MERLILMRHGKAQGQAASGEDFDRELAQRGVEDAAAVGATLKAEGLVPNLVLVSPAARTRQTWATVEPAFPGARVEYARTLYEAPARLIRDLAEVADARAVLVVGHNPGLQELATRLAVEAHADHADVARLRMDFPPATAAAFDFDTGQPRLRGLFYPEGRG